MKRRDLIRGFSFFPLGFTKFPETFTPREETTPPVTRDLFKELGVRKFINAAGTYTFMTGSLMFDEVMEAINSTSKDFCLLDELQDKVGAKIAEMVHAESAVVTAGCFSAMTLGLAGVLTGLDEKKVEMLPNLEGTGLKSEVIMQKGHNIGYSHALMNTGCKIVEIESITELENAINDKTALLWFLNIQADKGTITHEQWVEMGKKHGIPTMIDIAADVPPVSNLWKFNDMGFDLVCISGGKALRGPQSAGLLMGKKDLIAAARLSMPPRGSNVGRGMKVNKEEIFGMYVAVDKFIKQDHDKVWKGWEKSINLIESSVKSVPDLKTRIFVPPLGNITPTLELSWDPEKLKMTEKDVQEKLRNGNPSIEVISHQKNSINITAWVMRPGDDKLVAKRLGEVFSKGV